MTQWLEVQEPEAYRLIGHGPVVLVCTCSLEGRYDIAPVAWNCPVKKDPARVLLALGHNHQTYQNIRDRREFVVCVPTAAQRELVIHVGSTSGADIDKYADFAIDAFEASKVKARIPAGVFGYIECELWREFPMETNSLVVGHYLAAAADAAAFDGSVRTDQSAGKSLHHLGSKVFYQPPDDVL